MRIATVPFERSKHLEDAAWLLSERHRRDRARDARLPAVFEAPDPCRPLIEQALAAAGAQAVAAVSDGRTVGFAVMSPQLVAPTHFLAQFFPPRGCSIQHSAHAAAAAAEHDAYREMYAALAEHFVAQGFFEHAINVAAGDGVVMDALVSLGFGRGAVTAMRGVDPVERATANGIDIHLASAEDEQVIFRLMEELMLHHARPPIFQPYMRETDESEHDMQHALLQQPEDNAHWVAYENGRAVGMNTFMPPSFLSPLTLPEKTVYLFQGIVTDDARASGVGSAILSRGVAWARERGYEHVALHFMSANIPGAAFWQSSGFRPIEFRMQRHIDERIAWANR